MVAVEISTSGKYMYKLTKHGNIQVLYMYVDEEYVGMSQWEYNDVNTVLDRFSWFINTDCLYSNDDITYIQEFYICEDSRGKGYSHKLIRKTLAFIRKDYRNAHICLTVSGTSKFKNRSLYKLYKSHKFKRYGTSPYMFIYKRRYYKIKSIF